MMPTPYENLTDLQIIALCVWREARGEPVDGKRGVAHVIANRVKHPGWWGRDWKSVVLKPFQFSSFNKTDPNSNKWPVVEEDAIWTDCMSAASGAYLGLDDDLTEGAQFYHDSSIAFPAAWGPESQYVKTLKVGRLSFYRMASNGNRDQVQAAVNGD